MKKIILIFLVLCILPVAFSEEATFPNTITISTLNNTINITTEQDSRTFQCNTTSTTTTSYTFNLKRNLSDCISLTDTLDNFTKNVNSLFGTCETITKQYGDVNRYFSLYTQCNADLQICQRERNDKDAKISELSPFQTNYNNCNGEASNLRTEIARLQEQVIPSMQLNITATEQRVIKAEKSKILWLFYGMLSIGGLWVYEKKKGSAQLNRHKQPGLGTRR